MWITYQSCVHGINMIQCRRCNSGAICMHGNIRSMCKPCLDAYMCEHNYRKVACPTCSPHTSKCIIM